MTIIKTSRDRCPSCGAPYPQTWKTDGVKITCGKCDPELIANRESAKKEEMDREINRKRLIWAMRTRLLTVDEVREVCEWDYFLMAEPPFGGVTQTEMMRQFNDLLFQQFRFRAITEGKS